MPGNCVARSTFATLSEPNAIASPRKILAAESAGTKKSCLTAPIAIAAVLGRLYLSPFFVRSATVSDGEVPGGQLSNLTSPQFCYLVEN
jgi:hypothetical protein